MDTAQWPQEIVVKPMEEIVIPNTNTNTSSKPNNCVVERKVRPHKDQAVNCPRCNSTNTKFCYYNNYSLSQPRYFCKTCRRYWTEGGSLRNIPVGGGSRKNKKSSSSSSSNSNSPYSNTNIFNNNPLKKLPDLVPPPIHQIHQNPSSKIHNEGSQDLNLGFSSDFKTINDLIQVPNYDGNNNNDNNNSSITISPLVPPPPPSSASTTSALELMNGITSSRGLNNNNNGSFMSSLIPNDDPNSVYNSSGGFSLLPSLNFSLDHHHHQSPYGNNNEQMQETNNTSGRFLFPFVGLKQVSSANTTNDEQNNHQPAGDQSTYWNGMLGGGGSW